MVHVVVAIVAGAAFVTLVIVSSVPFVLIITATVMMLPSQSGPQAGPKCTVNEIEPDAEPVTPAGASA